MSGRIKITVVILVILVVCTFALAAGLSVLLNSGKLRTVLLDRLNTRITGTLAAGDHHISFISGEVRLHDLQVRNTEQKTLAGIDLVSIDFSLASLFRKTVIVEKMTVVNPRVLVRRDAAGIFDIADALSPAGGKALPEDKPESGSWFNVVVKRFDLSGGDITYTDGNTALRFVDAAMTAQANLGEKSAVVKLNAGPLLLKIGEHPTELKTFDLAFAVKDGHMDPVILNVENSFAALLAAGDIHDLFSNPDLDLQLNADIDIAALESFLEIGNHDTGNVNAQLKIKGRPHNPDMELRIGYDGGELAGYRIRRLEWLSHVVDRTAVIDRLAAETDFGRLQLKGRIDLQAVFPNGPFLPGEGFEKADYKGILIAEALDLSAIKPLGDRLAGLLDGVLSFRGQGVKKLPRQADADLSVSGFRYGGMTRPVDIRLNTSGRLENGMARLDHLALETDGAAISLAGSLEVDSGRLDADFCFISDDLAAPLSLTGMDGIGGSIQLDGKAAGSWEYPLLNVNAAGEDLRYKGVSIGDARMEAQLRGDGRLKVMALDIANSGSSLTGSGNIQLLDGPYRLHRDLPLSAKIVFSNLEYVDFFKGQGSDQNFKGLFSGNLNVEGRARALKAAGEMTAMGLAWGGVDFGKADGRLRFDGGTLLVDGLRITGKQSRLSLAGEVSLFQKDTWQLLEKPVLGKAAAKGNVFLEDFFKGTRGELVLDADLHGDLTRPQGSLDVAGRRIDLGFQRIDSLALSAVLKREGITLEPVSIMVPGGAGVTGSGSLGYDKIFQFHLNADDISLENMGKGVDGASIEGSLSFDIKGKGPLDRPEIEGHADLTGIFVMGESVDDLELQFNLMENRAVFKGAHLLDLDAEYDLIEKTYFVDLNLMNSSLAPWFAIAGRPELGGKISGRISAKGHAGNLKRSHSDIDIGRLDVTFKDEKVATAENIKGALLDGEFEIPGFGVSLLDECFFSVKGSGDISGAVDMRVDGHIPLKAVNWFWRDLPEIKGFASVSTSLSGTIAEPHLSGEIGIEKAGAEIQELQQNLHSINGRVALSADEELECELSGMLDDGAFDIKARIALDGLLPKRIEAGVQAVGLPFQIPDTMDVILGTDLSVAGTPDDLLVGGELVILEGAYYKDFKLDLLGSLQEKEREAIPRSNADVAAFLKPLRFDVYISNRQPFVVDNNIADLSISPDIHLTGTLENPVITGSANVDTGTITYQNKSFVVQRGSVDFVNPYQTEAEINIKGEVEIREWLITISLYGPPDRLTVELSSLPDEEDADIISLLVFKKTTYELNEGGGGINQSPTVLLAQLLASSFGEDIKESTGIDVLEVEAESAEDEDSTDRIKVTVGKDLTERMTVKYSVESKDGGYVQRASTEYKLLEHILVSGFQDTQGVYGGELIFRVEFRLFR